MNRRTNWFWNLQDSLKGPQRKVRLNEEMWMIAGGEFI